MSDAPIYRMLRRAALGAALLLSLTAPGDAARNQPSGSNVPAKVPSPERLAAETGQAALERATADQRVAKRLALTEAYLDAAAGASRALAHLADLDLGRDDVAIVAEARGNVLASTRAARRHVEALLGVPADELAGRRELVRLRAHLVEAEAAARKLAPANVKTLDLAVRRLAGHLGAADRALVAAARAESHVLLRTDGPHRVRGEGPEVVPPAQDRVTPEPPEPAGPLAPPSYK